METDQLMQHGMCYMCVPTGHLEVRRGSAGPLRSKNLTKMVTFPRMGCFTAPALYMTSCSNPILKKHGSEQALNSLIDV